MLTHPFPSSLIRFFSKKSTWVTVGLFTMALAIQAQTITWQVQSDYFAERNAVAQTRTIRSMALSKDGSAVYTGNIQSPNVGSNAIRKVSSGILATPGTDHVIFGNGMPGGTGAFGPVGGQPVYAGGSTGAFLGWTATGNSPRGLATDDRGYVYAALSSGISPANQVIILSSDLSTTIGTISITGPTGVSVFKSGSTYYLYIAADTQLKRYDVTNAASPVPDAGWTNTITSGAQGLTVDKDGTVFLAGGNMVRRISATGTTTHTVSLTAAADIAVFRDKIYVIKNGSPAQSIAIYNKADLTGGGDDLVVPELGAYTRGTLSQFTAIDVTPDGRLWVSEENYTGGSNGLSSYTPPATTFNPTPGAITGRIYLDRVLVSSPVADPCDASIDMVATTAETCPGANDGGMTITASTSAGPLTYAISGPVSASNGTGVFTNLPDGIYSITVTDEGTEDCEATTTATVAAGVDAVPPTIDCDDQTVVFNGESSITLDAGDYATADDNCSLAGITLSPSSVNCSQVGTTVSVTGTATDQNNNSTPCNFQLTVEGLPCSYQSDEDGVNCPGGNEVSYDDQTGVFTIESTNCYYGAPYTSDGMGYVSYSLCGDGSITAEVTGISGGQGWAGVIMREDGAPGAKKVQLTTNLSGNQIRREVRYTTNGQAYPQQALAQNRFWMRIVRQGNQFIGYTSSNGIQWFQSMAVTVSMNSCIEMGLVVTNYTPNSTVTATFDNVSTTGGNQSLAIAPGSFTVPALDQAPDFSVFPSPTSGMVQVDLAGYFGKKVCLEVLDPQGQLIQRNTIEEVQGAANLDLSALSGGVYFIRVIAEGVPGATEKVVLQRR